MHQVIYSVPTTIASPCHYCLNSDLSATDTFGTAIQINADDVTLDLSGHILDGLPAGSGTSATGISGAKRNAIVRNGTVRGFQTGISLGSTNAVVENLFVDRNTIGAIHKSGPFTIIRDNRVTDIGTTQCCADIHAIDVSGQASRVLNNDVNHVFSSSPGFHATAIAFSGGSQYLAVNNRLTGAGQGIFFLSGATGKYRDNLTAGVTSPFIGGTSAGNTTNSCSEPSEPSGKRRTALILVHE